jgi:hypothetical protein
MEPLMKTLKHYLQLSEAAKHTLSDNRLDFPGDEDVVEVVLTRTDPYDIARIIAQYAVLVTYREMSKEKDRHDRDNELAEPEDREKPYDFSIKEFASRASDNAYDIGKQVKEHLGNMRDADFVDIIKHFFPEHEKANS